MPVEIAFVTANYNTLEWVRRLTDFFNNLDVPFSCSFTVVDNNSTDGSLEFLRSHPETSAILNGENVGYGRAINRAVTATSSKYVCVMNTDVILNRDALVALWRFMEERPDAGVCAPQITYADGRLQGMVFNRSLFAHYANWYGKAEAWRLKMAIAKAKTPLPVDGVLGAFFLIRRSVIPFPKLFDEDFFFFHEDTALAHALKNRGVPCFVVPGATIVHIGGQSRSESSVPAFYGSKYLYLNKFYGSPHARGVYMMDRVRILRKWSFYTLASVLSDSDRIKAKQRFYKMAWNTNRAN